MSSKYTLVRKVLLALILSPFSVLAQSAGSYDLGWSTIDGAGGASSGGRYALSGTIGQPDAGELRGGSYVLVGGFWGGAVAKPELSAALQITTSSMNVILSWPNALVGFRLQQTFSLAEANVNWTDVEATPVLVGDQDQIRLPITSQSLFYRLIKR